VTHLGPSRRTRALLSTLSVLVLAAVAGCGTSDNSADSTAGNPERSLRTNVPFKSCDQVACTGDIDGAAYEIKMPERWNGTLLLYSHGYRFAEPSPPDFEPVSTAPAPAPSEEVGTALLAKGYALAGSAFASNGWAVQDGVSAGEKLHDFFVDKVAKPDRVYVWGDSLGGLITETLAEKHPEWVAGAAPLCGVLGGTNLNLDLALDAAYAVKTLIYPQLKLTGFASNDEAVQNWQGAFDAISKAGGDVSTGVPKILMVAALVDAPTKTRTYDGSTLESQVRARAESLLTALGYGTYGRYEIEQRVGGNPSTNEGTDYSTRVSADERALIDSVAPGAADRLLDLLADGDRVSADGSARTKSDELGNPTGALADPTLTIHTTADPLVLAQNETVFADRVGEHRASPLLAQAFIEPPATYSQDEGAPYGAGHCNFSVDQRVTFIDILDGWARQGVYPTPVTFEARLGDAHANLFDPGPWPADES
jgi:pimeloyl-ACP methyl ester carboxylesterase